ncbi:putative N-acetyltransferase YhbS [Taibaiella chishuiensis]|uniref:Putative N-acetyltransferase YhbS n=2 Tax=Taibaiella chishuiensis TaxID=1434707 RepID=A0A2P8CXY5_9BACT|nr:putative N-acetyltransferase YhbS [Taibaiella chishuiensis]
MEINIRQETAANYQAVSELIRQAFAEEVMSDHREQFLVERLRQTEAFVPELSLVAATGQQITGYILLTPIHISNGDTLTGSLALAPVAVLPAFQGKGIGAALIQEAHRIARELGYSSIVLLGHETYYPRFGYERASTYNIRLPFEAPDENCMILALQPGVLDGVSGMVVYPEAFFQ